MDGRHLLWFQDYNAQPVDNGNTQNKALNTRNIPMKWLFILLLSVLFEIFCFIVVIVPNGLMKMPMIKYKLFKSALIAIHSQRVPILKPSVIFILFLRKLS